MRVVARRDPAAPTGLLVKEHRRGRPTAVRYYRSGSAAAQLTPEDLDEGVIADAGVLHLTGITPALGEGPAAAVHRAIAVARAAGALVSFDVNYRASLWSPVAARAALAAIVPRVDVLFAGPEEAALLVGEPSDGDPWTVGRELARRLAALGPAHVVVKLGEHGALAWRDGSVEEVSAHPVDVVDAVGAGDAFVGGYLAALVTGQPTKGCLDAGARLGALVCGARGDWEGLLDEDGRDPAADVIR